MMDNKFLIQAALTERCNLKCLQCNIRCDEHKRPELTTGQWFDIFLKIKKWIGPYQLNVGGGEPFMRKDILEIIKFCVNNEIWVCLTTNATLLDSSMIAVLSDMELLTLHVSLDGFAASTHDYLRGEGIYQKVMHVLSEFKTNERKCKLKIATVMMQNNFKDMVPILKKMVMEEGLADSHVIQPIWISDLSGKYKKEWYKNDILWPDVRGKKELLSEIDQLIELKKKGVPIDNSLDHLRFFKLYFTQLEKCVSVLSCNIGDRNFIINTFGEVLLCWLLKPIGDILKESPSDIWTSRFAIQRREQIKACKMPCRILNCNFDHEKIFDEVKY